MKNKKLLLASIVGGTVSFISCILISLLMEKLHFGGLKERSLEATISSSFVVSAVAFTFLYFYQRHRLNKKEAK